MEYETRHEETDALARLLRDTIYADHYPLWPRVQMWKGILAKIRPEAKPEPLPPPETLRSAEQKPYRGREAPSSVWTGMPAPRFL
jgi:hypothetical protein